jgi:protein phosphatase
VLCSDGINKEMSDAEIDAACRRSAAPEAVLNEMFDIALGRAARDNVSAVVVRLQD